MNEAWKSDLAVVSHMPGFSGDGYSYGGGAVLTIGGLSIPLGEGSRAIDIARELANRWNAALPPQEKT